MSASVRSLVARHADALDDIAKAMAADGIGLDARSGHTQFLKRMASSMRAEAAVGKLPHAYHDGMYAASDDTPKLPFAVLCTLAACGVDLGKADTIALGDLDASMDAAQVPASDRLVVKGELARLGRLTS